MRARRAWFSQVRARMLLNRGHTGSSGSCRGPSWLPIANLPPAAEQREKQKPRQLLQRRVERKGLRASLSSEAPTNRSIDLLLLLCSLLLTAAAGTTHCSGCCCCCFSVFVCVCACVACYTPCLSIHIHKRSWPTSLISRAPLRACARWSSTTSCLLYVVSLLLLLVVVLVAIVQQLPPPRCTPADRPCHHQQASELFDHLEGALALHAAESNSNAELRAQGTRTWPNHVSDLSRSGAAARAGARCPTSIRSHQLLVCAS